MQDLLAVSPKMAQYGRLVSHDGFVDDFTTLISPEAIAFIVSSNAIWAGSVDSLAHIYIHFSGEYAVLAKATL